MRMCASRSAARTCFFLEQIGVAESAQDKETGFETGNAVQPPLDIGQVLHQLRFAFAHGLEFRRKTGDMRFIESGILARQQDGASGQTRFIV
jgi:hypothetical protein